MGCGASSGAKYKSETAPASTEKVADGAAAEPAKPEPAKADVTAAEPPAEKPSEEVAAPAQQEAVAAEPPAGGEAAAADAPPAEVPVAGGVPAVEEPAAAEAVGYGSEPGQSVEAEAVVAEAEAALAESDQQLEAFGMRYEDPEFPSFGRMATSSAMLELDRSSGASLGLAVRGAESILLVTKVEGGGLVAAWNEAHPDRAVHAGHCVIQVNGLSGIAEELLEELRSAQLLRVEVDRTEREVRAAVTSEGMAHWCREQIQGVYERHDEAGLKTLDKRMQTYKDRELALYRTLSKKFGEEPKDPEMCANSVEDVVL